MQYSRVQYSTIPWYGCELAGEVFRIRTSIVKGRKEPAEEMKESIWTNADPSESIWTDVDLSESIWTDVDPSESI